MSSKILEHFKVQQIFLFALFSVVLSVYGDKLEPIYEKGGDHYKLFRIGQPLILQCKPKNQSDGKNIFWLKDGMNVTEKHELKVHVYTVHKEGKLIIEKFKEEDAGKYSCNLIDETTGSVESHDFEIWAQVIVRVAIESSQITEDNDVEIVCLVKGTDPSITWEYKPELETDDGEYETIVPNERLKIIKRETTSDQVLTIQKAQMSDRGHYRCNAINDRMMQMNIIAATDEEFVRIKDKMAPLWPAIGMVVQLVVLILVIVISEKRRNQNEVDDSDTDEAPEKKEESNFIRNRD